MRAGRLGLTLAPMLVMALAGCASNPQPVVPPPPPAPAPPEPASAEQRARARLDLAAAYLDRQQHETALQEIDLALQHNPRSGEAWTMRAVALGAMGDDAGATAAFDRAVELNPRDGSLLHNHGWFLCQRGRFDDAQVKFQQALATAGYRDVARTQLARGVCFGRAGRWLEAEGALARAHELEPGNPQVTYNLAEVLYRRADLERARAMIARLNDLSAVANAQSMWLAARIEHRAGRADAVRALCQSLKTRFPQSAEAAACERGQFDDG